MNLTNNLLPKCDGLGIKSFKLFGMSIATVWKNRFVKFHKLFANEFFASQIRIDCWKNFGKLLGRKTPNCGISFTPTICANKTNASSESVDQPGKDRKFSVSNLKSYCVNVIGLVFRLPFFYAKTSFGINQPSKISKIFFARLSGRRFSLKGFYSFFSDKIVHIPHFSDLFNKFISFQKNRVRNCFKHIWLNGFSIFHKNLANSPFFNQVGKNDASQSKTFAVFNSPAVLNLSPRLMWLNANRPTKFALKQFQNISFSRNNLDQKLENRDLGRGEKIGANIKASIPFQISGAIRSDVKIISHSTDHYTGKPKLSKDPQRLSGRDALARMR